MVLRVPRPGRRPALREGTCTEACGNASVQLLTKLVSPNNIKLACIWSVALRKGFTRIVLENFPKSWLGSEAELLSKKKNSLVNLLQNIKVKGNKQPEE